MTSACAAGCGQYVVFRAGKTGARVIANVYVNGRWDRVEHFHEDCYVAAGEPYGEALR